MSYGRGNNRYGGRSGYSGGYSRYGSGVSGPKPVEVGKEYNVEVTELSKTGDGVAKIQGFIIFVRGSKVGEKVKIKIEPVGPRFSTTSVLGNAEPSGAAKSSVNPSGSASSAVTEPV